MKTFPVSLLVALLGSALLGSGCTETHAESHDDHEHAGHAHSAATFKEGHGLQLAPDAAKFIDLQTAEFAEALPATALLRTIKGDFVFVANGDWYLRTPVKVAPADSGRFSVQEGLYEGDTIVTHGTEALWLAELQATNGGVGCADGH